MERLMLVTCILFGGISAITNATIYCSGKINTIHITASGDLLIKGSWRDDYTRLCNLNGTLEGISTVTCSMWASYAATALKDKKKVLLSYHVEDMTCSTLLTYNSAPKPHYFMLKEDDVD